MSWRRATAGLDQATPLPAGGPRLRRSLGLWDLVLYGIILIQPTAPMPLFGVVSEEARGHVVSTLLIAMVAMLFTAVSYGRMARVYPSAGSAYTFVGREVHPALGYLTGWSMVMDYILVPIICTIWASKAAGNILPLAPYWAWVIFFALLFTCLNLRGIRATARVNAALAAGMGVVVLWVLVAAARYVAGLPGLDGGFFTRPFYNPATFSSTALFTGTSIAVLTYIGFDGISTLSEEVHNPRRNVLLATVLTCILTGVLGGLEIYAAQLIWPHGQAFPDVDTAYVHVAGRAGGPLLFHVVNLTLLVASLGSGLGGQLAAGRLLYGMGRDNAIPQRFFGAIEPKSRIPRNNILLTGGLALAGSLVLNYQLGAELLNFGAFIAFMGVNAAAFLRYYVRQQERRLVNFFPPLVGFMVCFYIWLSLRTPGGNSNQRGVRPVRLLSQNFRGPRAMRIATFVGLAALAAAALPAEELKLIPYPRSVRQGEGKLVLPSPVRIVVRSNSSEDRFAAGLLAEEIKTVAGSEATVSAPAAGPAVVIGRAGDPHVDGEVARLGLDGSALQDPEGYVLAVHKSGVLLAARTGQGVFYGVQTLRQLIGPESGPKALSLPVVSIADRPALRHRGLMVDTSQGAVLSEEMLKSIVRTAAAYKYNLVNLYVEHLFPFSHSPLTAEGAQLGFDEMKRLAAYARRYHVDVVPQQQTFGHLHSLLRWELYSGMAETTRGDVLAVGDERSYQWVFQACKELAQVFPSRFLHIGADETFELGRGRSKELVDKQGMGKTYAGHLRKLTELLRPLNKKLIFWGDIVMKNPEGISELPKDLIVATWGYKAADDFASYITPFRRAGMEVWVCPGVGNWRRIFPNCTEAAANINNFVEAGKKLGATGMLNTHWNDHGEELFNLAWYGIVFGAAASWQEGKVDVNAFDRGFDWAFYRNDGDVFVRIIRRLEGVNGLLLAAGQGEADNELAWFDPFSRRGAARVRRLLPLASEIRRRAEEALVDLHHHAPRARLHAETIPFLRFAARRLDAVGLRIQVSRDIADYYRDALAHSGDSRRVAHDLREISARSGVGRIQDIHDAVAELRAMLKSLWPAENRPYYLESLLVRYDAELLYWHQKRRLFLELRSRQDLPAAESLGLHLP